ncbi:MAG: hypothetical protein HYZ81_02585 [Nitrospinae bacterium]|nr:hypothetical protein [Nitrospinota bacterium]
MSERGHCMSVGTYAPMTVKMRTQEPLRPKSMSGRDLSFMGPALIFFSRIACSPGTPTSTLFGERIRAPALAPPGATTSTDRLD